MQYQSVRRKTHEDFTPDFLVAGALTRDYIIDPSGRAYNDIPGGSALFCAAGIHLWGGKTGIIAAVGEDYPNHWLEQFQTLNISTSGVNVIPHEMDLRQFFAVNRLSMVVNDNPVAFYARYNLNFPKSLLGYHPITPGINNNFADSLPVSDDSLPPEYLHSTAAHLCAMDLNSQIHLATNLRKYPINTLTLEPSSASMTPQYWEKIPAILESITAFFPSEKQMLSLFQGRSNDLFEIAEAASQYACKYVIIRKGNEGFFLYDAYSKKRHYVPLYPSKMLNPVNIGDALCGGFLSGYKKTYDPLEALLIGVISASHAAENPNPIQMTSVLSGLSLARLEALRHMVQPL